MSIALACPSPEPFRQFRPSCLLSGPLQWLSSDHFPFLLRLTCSDVRVTTLQCRSDQITFLLPHFLHGFQLLQNEAWNEAPLCPVSLNPASSQCGMRFPRDQKLPSHLYFQCFSAWHPESYWVASCHTVRRNLNFLNFFIQVLSDTHRTMGENIMTQWSLRSPSPSIVSAFWVSLQLVFLVNFFFFKAVFSWRLPHLCCVLLSTMTVLLLGCHGSLTCVLLWGVSAVTVCFHLRYPIPDVSDKW